MARVCDFTVIQGDANKRIGDGAVLWEKNFSTGGREGSQAFLMFMVKGLTYAISGVEVTINDRRVGVIFPYRWPTEELRKADQGHWYTQIINVGASNLRNGSNELQILAKDYPEAGTDKFDDFYIRDMIIFFQQRA